MAMVALPDPGLVGLGGVCSPVRLRAMCGSLEAMDMLLVGSGACIVPLACYLAFVLGL
jgi:hypothetical protein